MLAASLLVAVLEAGAQPPVLTNADCKKCHPDQQKAIFEDGERHRTRVTCLDCHVEHPPRGTNAVPACSRCHQPAANKHFAARAECLTCHQDPHRPLLITFREDSDNKPACLSCHPYPGDAMQEFPSAHAEVDCSFCHPVHRTFKTCLKCHQAHVEGMDYGACLRCHQPHEPTHVAWSTDIPSTYCGGCHPEQLELQRTNKTKHGAFICVFCHRFGHGPDLLPECLTCHGNPHDKSIANPTNCLSCHIDPHAMMM
ncbi:MAG: hypothetical protein AB1634_02000 [Thermodesulfobacteriota bacterium]